MHARRLPKTAAPASADYSQRWVAAHRGHAIAVGRSAFSTFAENLLGDWRVWCVCGSSILTTRASADMICLVARRDVLRMDVDRWKATRPGHRDRWGERKTAV